MAKITVHGGATNASEPGYFEAIDVQTSAADGLPGSLSAYGLAPMHAGASSGADLVAEYRRRFAELEAADLADLSA